MKWQALILSAFVSTAAVAKSPYELVSVPHREVDKYMTLATDATGTPENLQGLWWMNGNPLPDEVVSFAGITWEAIEKDGETVGYRGSVPVYDQGVWSWHDSFYGRALYDFVLKSKLVYVIEFNADFTFAQVTPTFKPINFLPSLSVPPSMFVDFDMRQVSENEFARESVILGAPSTYRFRRIVDGNGKRLPAFDEFLKAVEAPNALLPYCKNNEAAVIPSPCAR